MSARRVGPSVSVKLEGLKSLQNRLSRAEARLRNPETLTAGLAATLEAQTKRRIQDEKTAPDGAAWQQWAADTAAERSGNHSLLLFEGHLRDSITGFHDARKATVGSSMIYAAVHQFGWAARNIPARPFLGISSENEKELDHLVNEWLAGALDA